MLAMRSLQFLSLLGDNTLVLFSYETKKDSRKRTERVQYEKYLNNVGSNNCFSFLLSFPVQLDTFLTSLGNRVSFNRAAKLPLFLHLV